MVGKAALAVVAAVVLENDYIVSVTLFKKNDLNPIDRTFCLMYVKFKN